MEAAGHSIVATKVATKIQKEILFLDREIEEIMMKFQAVVPVTVPLMRSTR